MKHQVNLLFKTSIFLLFISCHNEPVGMVPVDVLKEDISINDPKSTGCNIGSCVGEAESPKLLDSILPDLNLPQNFDLSSLMPPVRSQGGQGSCVSFATTYYLKSYQEKVQNKYDFITYDDVMSPAFVYNFSKSIGDCNTGSCIENALYVLKTKGTNTWSEFPYNPFNCNKKPSVALMESALKHRISKSYKVNSFVKDNQNYKFLDIAKTLIYQENPIIIAIKIDRNFVDNLPKRADNLYVYERFDYEKNYGNHAMLIVGYNDELKAFKVVNSWGTGWGDKGYCWISYDFFREPTDLKFQSGILGAYIAYDKPNI
jgi:cathepsin K